MHRAPKGRDREGQYFNFCVDHVREYNKSYNYFTGMGDDDVRSYQKDSLTGHRPTWKMGVNKQAADGPDGYDPACGDACKCATPARRTGTPAAAKKATNA